VGTTFVTGTANAVLIQWRVVMLSVFHKLSSVPNTPRSLEFPRLFIGRSSPFFAVSGLSEVRRFRRVGSSHNFVLRSHSALAITETEFKLIAAPAMTALLWKQRLRVSDQRGVIKCEANGASLRMRLANC